MNMINKVFLFSFKQTELRAVALWIPKNINLELKQPYDILVKLLQL